jgi:hypothetical protein
MQQSTRKESETNDMVGKTTTRTRTTKMTAMKKIMLTFAALVCALHQRPACSVNLDSLISRMGGGAQATEISLCLLVSTVMSIATNDIELH